MRSSVTTNNLRGNTILCSVPSGALSNTITLPAGKLPHSGRRPQKSGRISSIQLSRDSKRNAVVNRPNLRTFLCSPHLNALGEFLSLSTLLGRRPALTDEKIVFGRRLGAPLLSGLRSRSSFVGARCYSLFQFIDRNRLAVDFNGRCLSAKSVENLQHLVLRLAVKNAGWLSWHQLT